MPKTRTPKLPPIPEKEVQANGILWLQAQGCLVFRRNVGAMGGEHNGKRWFMRFAERGQSDTWLVFPKTGFHGEVEWKREGERPTLDQVNWLIKVNGHGGSVGFWVDNLDRLERVYRHVVAGGRIAYSKETRLYTVKRRGKTFKEIGPTGDYELI